ncbi:MAG: AAA family ATPase [Syntrophorhabdales bacterium]|jgi:type II secretory pathway predicted ATPase ExeA
MQATELQDIALRVHYPGHFALKARPFRLTPDPVFYFDSRTHSEALRCLQSFVHRGEGLSLIYGEVGTGKTLLCKCFLEGLDRKAFNTGLILNPMMNAKEFHAEVLRVFDIVPRSHSTKAAMFETLRSLVEAESEKGKQSVLAVDEAQLLSDELLDLLARHSDSKDKGGSSLRVVLFAQEELTARLVDRRLRHLRRRITMTHCLQPLAPDEIRPYIMHRLATAGSQGLIRFDEDAIEKIYRVSKGHARIVNIVGESCLLLLDERSRTTVTRRIVGQVLREEGIPTLPKGKTSARGWLRIAFLKLLFYSRRAGWPWGRRPE